MKNKKTLGSLLLLFTAMIWGTAFAFQRAGRGAIQSKKGCKLFGF